MDGHQAPFLLQHFILCSEIEQQRFTFLNLYKDFKNAIDWTGQRNSRLWRYNLHYFDYLFPDRPLAWEHGQRLIEDWIGANPAGTPDAWDPFPISLRLVNWIKYFISDELK